MRWKLLSVAAILMILVFLSARYLADPGSPKPNATSASPTPGSTQPGPGQVQTGQAKISADPAVHIQPAPGSDVQASSSPATSIDPNVHYRWQPPQTPPPDARPLLGHPFETRLTVEGLVHSTNDKGPWLNLRITSVDGRPLHQAVEIEPRDGYRSATAPTETPCDYPPERTYRLEGYESGYYDGWSKEELTAFMANERATFKEVPGSLNLLPPTPQVRIGICWSPCFVVTRVTAIDSNLTAPNSSGTP